ncbi:hypothetical protein E3N88_38503 [Mikania micrantha]|uniref:Uncharacterized protein n=1 Tax=Mikania micrantha TaxID=192012 RepID=A0A5N6LU59_9ASTR|nr:hypothetical protein E3N88_38503 [Mikania micrantha]
MNCNEYASILSDLNFIKAMNFNESFTDWDFVHLANRPLDSDPSNHIPQSSFKDEADLHEDSDFSDLVLKYINQMLMEEDIEEKNCMFQESAALQAAERSFYNALMVKDEVQDQDPAADKSYHDVHMVRGQDLDPAAESLDSFDRKICMSGTSLTCDVSESSLLSNTWINFDSHSRFHPSYSLFSSANSVIDRFVDSPVSILSFPDMFCDNRYTWQFNKGIDESSSFISNDRILDNVGTGVLDQKIVKLEKKHEISSVPDGSRGKKNPYSKDLVEDERDLKQSAIYSDPTVRSKMFDDVLLCGGAKNHPSQCEFVRKDTADKGQMAQPKGSNGVKARGKKQKEVVDLRTLLSLCAQPGGPPELRITGIDFPCPGFRPAQRVEETGRRLANYAETFGVRFKFKAIAQKWETIRLQDLELDDDETLVVNCAYRFRNLLDETVIVDSPRNKVLDLIRKMNPEIFIQGIVNGSYNAPFFLTRFREALFFFSSVFDMLDATIDRLTEERMLVEKTIWGREAMNVIACEGGERIERPEAYKQWQVRNQRAGFCQVPFDQEFVKMAKDWAISDYHKDFVIDEDGCWLLQGWKGRILYANSLWKLA